MQDFVFRQAMRAFTLQRFRNAVRAASGFCLSSILRRPFVWGLPPVITVEPTNYCNLKCPLCVTGSGGMRRAGGRMALSTFKRLIDEIGDQIWYVILYHQGEPYLNNAFLDCVRYAKSRGLYTETSTNAHYLDQQNAERTVASGLDAIIVSLDGLTQESYEKYRVEGDLQRVLAGIRHLVRAKERMRSKTPYVLLQFLVMRHNEHEIPEIRALAKRLGVDRLLLKNIQVESLAQAREWMPRNEKYQRYTIEPQAVTVKRGGEGICPRPWLSSLMNWDGSFVPCCFDKNGRYQMGNGQAEKGFPAIWAGTPYGEFRQRLLSQRDDIDICRNCNQGFGVWI